MNTLGMDKEELKRAELEQKQRTEQYYARERSKSSGAINKRDSAKALGVLGHDPSRAKVCCAAEEMLSPLLSNTSVVFIIFLDNTKIRSR